MIRVLCLLLVLAAGAPAGADTVVLYSHVDRAQAHRARALARTYDAVLIDAEIRPGDPWRATVAAWIGAADTILIVWSAAAARSPEVATEWRMALASRARVVPVLLDDTPLPPELAARQAVDWR